MSQAHQSYDQFAKRVMAATLEGTGVVRTDDDVPGGAQRTDVWYEPDPARAAERARRGVVGAMADEACGFEVFRRTPDGHEVLECVRKQLGRYHAQVVAAQRRKRPVPPRPPAMWVISVGQPATAMALCRTTPMAGWPAGFYAGASRTRCASWSRASCRRPATRSCCGCWGRARCARRRSMS